MVAEIALRTRGGEWEKRYFIFLENGMPNADTTPVPISPTYNTKSHVCPNTAFCLHLSMSTSSKLHFFQFPNIRSFTLLPSSSCPSPCISNLKRFYNHSCYPEYSQNKHPR
jgi:hypothetical protein